MPRHDTPVVRRLAEQLIVPKPDRSSEQLRGRNYERGVPQNVMERLLDPPCPQRVEQNRGRITRLIRVELIEQAMTGMLRVREAIQGRPQRLDLLVREHSDSGQIAVLLEKRNLLAGEAEPLGMISGTGKQRPYRAVKL